MSAEQASEHVHARLCGHLMPQLALRVHRHQVRGRQGAARGDAPRVLRGASTKVINLGTLSNAAVQRRWDAQTAAYGPLC